MPNDERQGKWQAFDGLDGFRKRIKKIEQRRVSSSKPVLMADELALLDEKLKKAIDSQNEVEIVFFQKGSFWRLRGVVSKVDFVFREIIVANKKISVSTITQIND